MLLVPSFISRLWFKVINFQLEIFNTHITLVVYKQSKIESNNGLKAEHSTDAQ